jgi:hypothetical protein
MTIGNQKGTSQMPRNRAAAHSDLDADGLPPRDTTRWVARRKAAILDAIAAGTLSRAEACGRYGISEAELRLWERAVACAGTPGLRVTRVQIYRPVFEGRER